MGKLYTMVMNGNLSMQQSKDMPSLSKFGAMPIKPKFDGPAPIKEPNIQGVAQPNQSIPLAKPGFF